LKKKPVKKTDKKISRKEALKKAGKYAAVTAIGSIILLTPRKAFAPSEIDPPGDGWPPGE
jgi:hypothetical protein